MLKEWTTWTITAIVIMVAVITGLAISGCGEHVTYNVLEPVVSDKPTVEHVIVPAQPAKPSHNPFDLLIKETANFVDIVNEQMEVIADMDGGPEIITLWSSNVSVAIKMQGTLTLPPSDAKYMLIQAGVDNLVTAIKISDIIMAYMNGDIVGTKVKAVQ